MVYNKPNGFAFFQSLKQIIIKTIDKTKNIWYNIQRHEEYPATCCYGSVGRAHPW